MKTFGIAATQELVSCATDENGNPFVETLAPSPRPEEWAAPDLIPLVKLGQPEFDATTHDCQPALVWFEDRVERDWQIVPLAPEKSRTIGRAALRAAWDALPSWIRGPYRDKFEAANRLLDEGDDEAARDLIKYATPLPDSAEAPLAYFEAMRAQMMAGIEALPK